MPRKLEKASDDEIYVKHPTEGKLRLELRRLGNSEGWVKTNHESRYIYVMSWWCHQFWDSYSCVTFTFSNDSSLLILCNHEFINFTFFLISWTMHVIISCCVRAWWNKFLYRYILQLARYNTLVVSLLITYLLILLNMFQKPPLTLENSCNNRYSKNSSLFIYLHTVGRK